jgi:hypothetical protein
MGEKESNRKKYTIQEGETKHQINLDKVRCNCEYCGKQHIDYACDEQIEHIKKSISHSNKYSEEDMKQFGLYLGENFKKLKGKTIDEIFEGYEKL